MGQLNTPVGLSYRVNSLHPAMCDTICQINSLSPPCLWTSSYKVLPVPTLLCLINPILRSRVTSSGKPSRHFSPSSLCRYFSCRVVYMWYHVLSQLYGHAHPRVASTLFSNKLIWICNWIPSILRAWSSPFIFTFLVFNVCWRNVFWI